MSDSTEERRVPPNGTAWGEAQKSVANRNDEARKAAQETRASEERRIAQERAARERGSNVYR